jgi:hypothetical protein
VWHELRRDSSDDTTVDFGSPRDCDACASLEQQVSELRDALNRERENHGREMAAARDERERERTKHEAEAREQLDQLAEFIAMIEN